MVLKKVLLIVGIVFFVLVGSVGGYGFYLYKSVQSTVNDHMHQTLVREKSEKRFDLADIEERDPLSFLLLGVDTREADSGRSDTIMVITVNPSDNSMKMVSIPRDTRTEIVGRGFEDKINHAYAYGGAEMAIQTVENFLDIPIDYFVTVNMEGFKEIIDALGGVTVQNTLEFKQGPYHYTEGELDLDGDQALAFARMRYEDPRGDLGRNHRQRQIVSAIINEGAKFSNITKAGTILESLGNNIATNLTFDEMFRIQSNYSSVRHNSETLEISGSGSRIDNIWYMLVSEEERLRVSSELRRHLELESSVVSADEEEDDV